MTKLIFFLKKNLIIFSKFKIFSSNIQFLVTFDPNEINEQKIDFCHSVQVEKQLDGQSSVIRKWSFMKTNGPNHTIVFTFIKKNGFWCTATFAKNIFFFSFSFEQNVFEFSCQKLPLKNKSIISKMNL